MNGEARGKAEDELLEPTGFRFFDTYRSPPPHGKVLCHASSETLLPRACRLSDPLNLSRPRALVQGGGLVVDEGGPTHDLLKDR